MPTIDRKPTPPREPIAIAGDLVRRDDRLSKEAAVCIRDLVAELAACRAELAEAKTALEIVATGIWRDKKMNACGLTGAALAVHAIEKIIGKKKTNKLSKP